MFFNIKYILISLLTLFLLTAPSHKLMAKENSAGKIFKLEGTAFIIREGKTLNARTDAELFSSDEIKTGPNSLVELLMLDGSSIHLGSKTTFELTQYKFNLTESQSSFLGKMAKGVFVYISGAISKLNPDAIKFETPEGTIGIRGTKLVAIIKESTGLNNDGKTIIVLFKDPAGKVGLVTFSNPFGRQVLNKEHFSITTNRGKTPQPQIFMDEAILKKMVQKNLLPIIFQNYQPPLPYTPAVDYFKFFVHGEKKRPVSVMAP